MGKLLVGDLDRKAGLAGAAGCHQRHQPMLGEQRPIWIVWPRLLRAIEEIWNFLGEDDLDEKSPLAQASALRRLLLGSTVEKLDTSLPDFAFGNTLAYPAETLIPFFIARITDLFRQLNSIASKTGADSQEQLAE